MRPQEGAYSTPTIGVSWGISTGHGALVTQDGYFCARKRISFVTNVEWKTQFRVTSGARDIRSACRSDVDVDRSKQPVGAKENFEQPAQSRGSSKVHEAIPKARRSMPRMALA